MPKDQNLTSSRYNLREALLRSGELETHHGFSKLLDKGGNSEKETGEHD